MSSNSATPKPRYRGRRKSGIIVEISDSSDESSNGYSSALDIHSTTNESSITTDPPSPRTSHCVRPIIPRTQAQRTDVVELPAAAPLRVVLHHPSTVGQILPAPPRPEDLRVRYAKKYYTVTSGQRVGIFFDWPTVATLTLNIPSNRQAGFKTWHEALDVYRAAYNANRVCITPVRGGEYDGLRPGEVASGDDALATQLATILI